VTDGTAQEWAGKIKRLFSESVPAIIETGSLFKAAKAELPPGEWPRMFHDHPEHVPDPLRCSDRTARRFMAIANNTVLSNRTHVSDLPPSWGTLYALSRVDDATLECAVRDGTVNPGMKRREVRRLLPPPKRVRVRGGGEDGTEPTPEQYRFAYFKSGRSRREFCFWPDAAPKPGLEMMEWAQNVIDAWTELSQKLKERVQTDPLEIAARSSTPAEAFAAILPTLDAWSKEDVREFSKMLTDYMIGRPEAEAARAA
jgi:hypothetical protein